MEMIAVSEVSKAAAGHFVLIPIIIIFFALFCFRFIIYPSLFSPLAKIPNAHWSSPYSSWWILWRRYREQELASVKEAHHRFGSIIRLGPTDISISSYEDGIRAVYGGGFEKPAYFDFFSHYGFDSV